MKIFVNRKIRSLFVQILLCILTFAVLSVALMELKRDGTALYALASPIGMGMAVLLACYRYFKDQEQIMEGAVAQVREYISGDRNARIECDEDGELYRLFHEVNSLAAILNAQAENEGRSKRFLKDTISDISHQLKTPLAALNIYNGIIQEEAGARDMQVIREFCGLSDQELDRIEILVQNLLKIAKFDAGTVVMEKRLENLSEIMEDVKKKFSFRAGQEGKEIALAGSSSLIFLCDRNWIMEAVGNIVKNALDHTGNGGKIRIEWGQSASVVRIVIQDNGSGIHPEDMYHIFKRFYRSSYSKDTQGIGLGLPLAKSVIEAHNGTVEAESQMGIGTIFVINFLV